ncbi:MAG TPA: glycosyltransferase family 1 protein [Burkholderiaceae bacterium]|nr:glycosyltransferase family 1 protein [Burkholderiaceae bacterium]
MRIVIVTDAWDPQINGVVRTLKQTRAELTRRGHEVVLITPQAFRTMPCPTYPEIRLSLTPPGAVAARLADLRPDAIHIATEGPLGLAARRFAARRRRPFTTAFHTRLPEYVRARTGLPLSVVYRYLRWFHGPAHNMMVPTPALQRELRERGFRNAALWSRGVDATIFCPGASDRLAGLPRPIFLNVGRVAVEKNLGAFLSLDLPGSKVVAGDGPQLAELRGRFPDVTFTGALGPPELAQLYRAADVFVFPSRTDTFGLVLLEAMACGLPVAAYPVEGPIDVVGASGAGVLDHDLRTACLRALRIPRERSHARASLFTWQAATDQFCALLAT